MKTSLIYIMQFIFLLLPVSICYAKQQQENKEDKNVKTEIYTSKITGVAYQTDVYLPVGYEKSTSKYPVIYATDGQWVSKGFSQIVKETKKDIVLVVIHQGPEDRRLVDYLLPGVHDYYQFLIKELLPHIEGNYRVDKTNRTLVGTSAGGMMVGTVLLIEDPEKPYFIKYLSIDAPFTHFGHKKTTWEMENNRYQESKKMKVTLFLTGALSKSEIGPFDEDVTSFEKLLKSRNYEGLEIIRKSYDADHYNIANPSFKAMLEQLF